MAFFEDIINSYHLDSEIKDDFHCNSNCFSQEQSGNPTEQLTSCTQAYNHISQYMQYLNNTAQQKQTYNVEDDASLFTTDAGNLCNFNIVNPSQNYTQNSMQPTKLQPQNNFHIHTKHKYTEIFLATLA